MNEPIINRDMLIGIAVQTVAKTTAVLVAFQIGLRAGETHGRTVAFATLAIAELFRAYTARSERYSLLSLGVFTNRFMQVAVLISLAILLAIIYVPFLDPIFNTTFLTIRDWSYMLPLMLLPAVADEITKFALRRAGRKAQAARAGA